jgi:hypothetical protein
MIRRLLEAWNDLETQDAAVPVGRLLPVWHEQLDVIDLKYPEGVHSGFLST